MNASELVVVLWHDGLHDLYNATPRDRNIVKDHDFALSGIEMFVNQADTDTFKDIMLVEQLTEVLTWSRLLVKSYQLIQCEAPNKGT
ncbi:hypothetical protein RRF57_005677 [Xylaria bambusicola]|uniref:Uncharacterized protein n=1 Tax=Xylaria bambusicola TaxID=326684 RepID=A0AAN7Z674_9PEZI